VTDVSADDLASRFDAHQRFLLIGLVCMVTVVATESMAVTTTMPLVQQDLGDIWLYGWAFSAFFIGNLVGSVVGGRATDRVAPVVPLTIAIAVFVAGLIVGGLAPSMPVLVIGRLLQGTGAGVVPSVMYVCVGRGFPAALRPKVFAITSTAWVVPSLIAPLAASFVATQFGWRWVFLGLVPITIVVAFFSLPAVRSIPAGTADPHRRVTPLSRVMLLAVGATLLLAGLTSANYWALFPLTAAGLLIGVPAFRVLTPAGTLSARPVLPAAILIRGLLTFSFFGADAFVSLALTSVRGTDTRYAGFVLAVSSLTWTAGAWIQARFHARVGSAALVRAGGACLAVGLTFAAVCLSSSVPLGLWFAAMCIAGLGMGLAFAPISSTTLAEAEPGREGEATSALQLSDVLGTTMGTGLAGVVVSVGDRIDATAGATLAVVYLGTAAMGLVVSVLAGRLVHRSLAGDRGNELVV